MKLALSFGVPAVLLVIATFLACSQKSIPFVDPDGGGDASVDGPVGDECGVVGCDASPGTCTNLQCQASPCAPQGKPETSLTGHVYDPAGNLPLYNVYVYIPNATPDPIDAGHPICTQCQAPPSGHPIIGRLTDETGAFNLQYSSQMDGAWGVPSGDNIPLVIQVGKWRRQLVIPHIDACTTLDLDTIFNNTPDAGKDRQLRLPGNGSEGDMPLMAFTSGCDPAECFLRHIGIDDSEFAPPGTGGKHVHFYTGHNNFVQANAGSSVTGGNTPAQTYQWWTNSANLLQYDIIFNACECAAFPRGTTAYGAMQSYLDGGGRLFTTHYYYNWFAPPTGPAAFQPVADWYPERGPLSPDAGYYVDSSFPKGQKFAAWLLANVGGPNVTGSVSSGVQVALFDTRNDVARAGPPLYPKSTRWIYNAGSSGPDGGPPWTYDTSYLSFNTPTTAPDAGMQCGRAVFSDVHLSGLSDNSTFPNECAQADPKYAANEKALEFLFFDLSSCVQDDTKPTGIPK
jgi:hypothetical protein